MYMHQAVTVVFCADDVWNGVGNQGLIHPCKKLARTSLSPNRLFNPQPQKEQVGKIKNRPFSWF